MENILMSMIKTICRMKCHGLVPVFLLTLCAVGCFELNTEICQLNNKQVGRCVSKSICPLDAKNGVLESAECIPGTVCCQLFAKIVTPDNGNSASASNVITANSPSNDSRPTGGNSPNGPATTTPSAASSTTRSPANGAASGGRNSRPTGNPSTGSNVPANGGARPNQPPANGASPTEGQPSAGLAPPLLGNIVAAPSYPWNPPVEPIEDKSDTIVVSAEEVDDTINAFDRMCQMYHSRVEVNTPRITNSDSPVVMIFGGADSEEKEFPHMAALGYGEPNAKRWLCGGSLISENFVLTAAHCTSTPTLGNVRYVRVGSLSEVQDTPNSQLRNVVRIITHEQYNSVTHYNDIALLQLDKPVEINSYIMPICLFSTNNYEDRNLIATGWGKTESGSSSLVLQKVGLELFTQAECQEVYKLVSREQLPLGIQQSTQLCAGSHSEIKDTCQGDSGGPLQIRKNNKWYLVGITSVGLQCGHVNVPGIYTRVTPYLQWIQKYIFK